jgi:ABC-2 type transport system ATP-binding protein
MVSLAAELSGLPRRHARQRAHEVLFYVGLGEQRYRPVSTYSTGMKQKVKLATAIVHDPPLLFLDEPTNGLDPSGRREMLALVEDLVTAKGKSVILSSHILSDVERVCRNAVLIEKGQLRAAGSLEDLTRFSVRIYQLRVGGDPVAVERLLEARGYQVTRAGEADSLEVAIPDTEGPEGIFAEVLRAHAHVRRLAAKRRTLEEVFMTAVGEA